MSNSVIRKNVIASKQRELRQKLWPNVPVELLWKKESKGFTSIPRTLPIFFEIMDSLSNGKPVSRVYFELWCRAFDEHFVTN